ncbi:expressed unknown protein [Seminavis robusta]|uniref:Uncharacterized protein n=1 Tax=Seminavis robusta TaxID=568900 RepID=A0A9N8DBG3_9STRA|nr:expressed unknown protein [Seminavis robusta]|eukprot:Sro69_g038400.1 n/a (301) ;mRNA; f:12811-13713
MRLNRRQRNPPPESPIFSSERSLGVESVNEEGTKSTFQARIIVTEGGSNIDPAMIEEPSQEAALDTTIALEEASECSDGNELVIITSAVLEPDSEEDEETAVAIEEAALQPVSNKKDERDRGRILKVITVVLILLVAAVIMATLLTGDDENKSEALTSSGGEALDMVSETMAPSYVDDDMDVHDEEDHMIYATAAVTASPSMESSSMSPTMQPTSSSPSFSPSVLPSESPSSLPSQSPSSFPSLMPSSVETETPTSTPTESSQQIFVSISQTLVATEGPSTANDETTDPPFGTSTFGTRT